MVSTIQTLSQSKSQKFIGHIKKHFITTSPLTYVANGIQHAVIMLIKGWVHLSLWPDNMLFAGLQHAICWTTTYNIQQPFDFLVPRAVIKPGLETIALKLV